MFKCKDTVIITIGRTFGSGGREIGKHVAEELGIPFYDKELLEVASKEGGLSLEYLRMYDEKQVSGLLYSMAFNSYMIDWTEPMALAAQNIQIKAILTVASKGPCVIIGRRADQILRGNYDTLNVFISASIDKRIDRVSKRENLSEKESKKKILKMDRARRSYYNCYGEDSWGDAANYNLCIDSGDLGIDNAADMIIQYLKLKGKLS